MNDAAIRANRALPIGDDPNDHDATTRRANAALPIASDDVPPEPCIDCGGTNTSTGTCEDCFDREARAQACEESAARHAKEAIDSFERCDTDGFLSQWASGICSNQDRIQADIERAGGVAEFSALFTTEGEWVAAKVIEGQWGERWMLLGADGRSNGVFLPYYPKRRSTLAKKGYVEGRVMRPAKSCIQGRGHGLSGTAWASYEDTSKATDPPVSVVTADRWEGEEK